MKTSSYFSFTNSTSLNQFVHKALVRSSLRPIAALAICLISFASEPAVAGPFPAEFELSDFLLANGGTGSEGTAFNGVDIVDELGHAVRDAGDINGDGIADFIMSSRTASPGGRSDAGQVYVVFGSISGWPAEFEISSLLPANGGDGSAGFILNGVDSSDQAGESVSGAGDINGDGIDDLAIGAPQADPANPTRGGVAPTRANAGEVYVVYGTNLGFAAEFELSTLLPINGGDGSAGWVVNGIDEGDRAGSAVSNAGDINDDGIDDLIIGASSANEAYVVFGSNLGLGAEFDLSTLQVNDGGDGSNGFVFAGILGDQSGRAVSTAGDINGDGIDDVLIGASSANPGGRGSAGRCIVVFGSDQAFSAQITLASLLPAKGGDGSNGFVLNGISSGDNLCRAAANAGDVNGDSFGDIVLGAERVDFPGRNSAGQSYIVFGTDQGFAAETELSSLLLVNGGDASLGIVFNGIDEDDESGNAVSGNVDINGDGLDDILIGAAFAWPGGREYAGETYVIYGKPYGHPAEFELSALLAVNGGNGNAGFVLNGIDDDDEAGTSVSAAGDVNNDGIGDLLVSANRADPGGRIRAGQVYVVFGQADPDTDGDGIGDTTDNCQLIANPVQCDRNGDGFGNHCDADLDNNGTVNSFDLSLLRASFGNNGPSDADLNCDQTVNSFDLSIMRADFGGPPGPSGLTP